MPGSTFFSAPDDSHQNNQDVMASRSHQQPPPVAPRTSRLVSLPSWPVAPSGDDGDSYGDRHARSGSMDSLESSGSSSGGSCSSASTTPHSRQETAEYIPTRTVGKTPKLPTSYNPLQFVKVQSPLCKKAEQQIKLTKEVKVTRHVLKEGEEEWQSNLDNWKSRRRKVSEKVFQRAEEMRQIEAEEQLRQEQLLQQQRKIKKFSEIVEKRSSKRTYNLDLYMGQGDDSGLGGTPEPDDQDGALDCQNSAQRSDTSEGMTSEAESIDSDIHRSDKIGEKEPPKVPKKPHPWTTKRDLLTDISDVDCTSPNELMHCSLSNKDLCLSDHISSAEPSDIEGHTGDTETVSSEDDTGYCGLVGNVDSGLESLCDGSRPGDMADSASDFSQDSCSGLDKSNHDGDAEFAIHDEIGDIKNKKHEAPLEETEIQDTDGSEHDYKLAVKPGDNKGFGFAIKGGKDQGCAVYVNCVTKENSPIGEKTKPSKKGCSFAEKLALFSTGTTSSIVNSQQKSPTSGLSQKVAKSDEPKGESLVLRRRSAFENGRVENGDLPNRRLSCISQGSSSDAVANGDKRHSADMTSSNYFLQENGVSKKGRPPPPPVPVKPKLKPKSFQSEQLNEVSAHEKLKMKRKTLVSSSTIQNEIVENDVSVCTLSEQMNEGDKMLLSCPATSDYILKSDVKEIIPDKHNSLIENKIINSLENMLPHEQKHSSENVYSESRPSDIQDLELVASSNDETFSFQCSELNVSSMNEKLIVSSAEFDHSSSYENLDNQNLSDETPYYKAHREDDDSHFRCHENILNYEDNSTDSYEAVILNDVKHNEVENIITSKVDTYNITCISESSMSPNATVAQTSPDSNSVDVESNLPSVANQSVSNNSSQNVFSESFQCENYTQDLYVDKENELMTRLSACTSSCKTEESTDYSETIESKKQIQITLSPLCLPLEKIDEDDVISASTTTSSETPDTETVIETLPSNISPLPNDELNGETASSSYQDPTSDTDIPLHTQVASLSDESVIQMSSTPICNEAENPYNFIPDGFEEQQDDIEYSREFDESLDQITSLDVIDEIEHRLMLQLEQQGDASFEDMAEDLSEQLEDEVNRQWLYLSEEAELLDDLAPRNLEPPREPPPPPPPPEVESAEQKVLPLARANSTKRIKKELWRRRSDFLGLDSPEGIEAVDIPPPPPGLEEILKQEREQNQWLEKRLSLAEADYSLPVDVMEPISLSSANTYSHAGEYTPEYFLEEDEMNSAVDDAQSDDYKENMEGHISYDDDSYGLEYEDTSEVASNVVENSKPSESPQHKAKHHIQSLGAAPKAKIMDSNKWITQAEKKFTAVNQKPVDAVFRHGSYNQNYWLAQDGERRRCLQRADTPAERRYSMPPTYPCSQPNVTVRTWGDREYEFQQQRPRSEFWNATSTDNSDLYSSKQDVSRTRSLDSHPEVYSSSDTLESEIHNCSCCGKGLCEGSAMGIEALQLYFHIECFRCCTCHIQLGNGSCGTDVQVKNNHLFCPNCFTVD